jgi:hypothetical protein
VVTVATEADKIKPAKRAVHVEVVRRGLAMANGRIWFGGAAKDSVAQVELALSVRELYNLLELTGGRRRKSCWRDLRDSTRIAGGRA